MDNSVKKFKDYIVENSNNGITETEIREFFKETCDELITDLFTKMTDKYPLKEKKITKDQSDSLKKINDKLIEICVDTVIENLPDFKSTWENEEEVVEVGDIVYDIETGDEHFVSKMGQSNNFYDHEKRKYVSLSSVSKKPKK